MEPQAMYLTFNEPDDFAAWVKRNSETLNDSQIAEPNTIHLEISCTFGNPGEHSIHGVYYYAVATQRVGDVIGVNDILLYSTDSMSVRFAKDEAERTKEPNRIWKTVQERFAKVRADWEARGVAALPGKWTHEAPDFLK